MRNAVLMFAGAVLAMVVSLLGYHFLIGVRQQDRLVASVDKLAMEQEKIRSTLSELQEPLAAADDKASLLVRDDLRIADGLKVALTEYYMSMGKLPATHADFGAPEPERYRGKSLKSARMLPDGSIELVFDANSGVDGGRILLRADFSHADVGNIAWYCESADYPLIKRVSPACDYRPAGVHVAQP